MRHVNTSLGIWHLPSRPILPIFNSKTLTHHNPIWATLTCEKSWHLESVTLRAHKLAYLNKISKKEVCRREVGLRNQGGRPCCISVSTGKTEVTDSGNLHFSFSKRKQVVADDFIWKPWSQSGYSWFQMRPLDSQGRSLAFTIQGHDVSKIQFCWYTETGRNVSLKARSRNFRMCPQMSRNKEGAECYLYF